MRCFVLWELWELQFLENFSGNPGIPPPEEEEFMENILCPDKFSIPLVAEQNKTKHTK